MAQAKTPPPTATEILWQEECARRVLLSHLGITPLVSRFDPAAAKPAERFIAPTDSSVKVLSTQEGLADGPPEEMQGEQLRALLRGDASDDVENDSRLSKASVAPATALSTPAKAEPTTEMPLALLIVTSDDILWIEVLEDQLLRQEQLQLIAAMARAIRGAAVRCAHQQLDWPPSGESALRAAPGGLEEMLSGFLTRLTTDHATQHIVQLGTCDALPAASIPIHLMPSSLEMLQDGAKKQHAWSVLKPLRNGA